jgi:CheY-like chemotaxis protein/sensor domain CHASE-containing protein
MNYSNGAGTAESEKAHMHSLSAAAVVLALAWCAAAVFFFFMLRASALRSESELCRAISLKVSSQISEQIDAMLNISERFRDQLLADSDKNYSALRRIAEESLASVDSIQSISIAPGAIIRYSFPEETATAAVGHDLLDNPERMKALVQAVSGRKAVLQGPSVSADGAHLAFIRQPVFDRGELWGFVSIAFDVDTMLKSLKIPVQYPGMRIAVSSREPSASQMQEKLIFWGDQNALSGYETVVKLGANDSAWSVLVASVYPATRALRWGLALIALNVAGAIGLLAEMAGRDSRNQLKRQSARRFDNPPENRNAAKESIPDRGFAVKPFVPLSTGEAISKAEPPPARTEPAIPPMEEAEASSFAGNARILNTETAQDQQKLELDQVDNKSPAQPGQERAAEKGMQAAEKQAGLGQRQEPDTAAVESRTISVLVVDDSEVNREILLRMLALKGYEAEAVESGAAALSLLKTHSFDVVLIDCIMPNMDGFALAREIKHSSAGADNKGKPVALIAMSPRHDLEEAERSAQAGFDSLLVKPFTMTALDLKIRERVLR